MEAEGEVVLGITGETDSMSTKLTFGDGRWSEATGTFPETAGSGLLVRQLGNFLGLPLFLLAPRGLEQTSSSTLIIPVLQREANTVLTESATDALITVTIKVLTRLLYDVTGISRFHNLK